MKASVTLTPALLTSSRHRLETISGRKGSLKCRRLISVASDRNQQMMSHCLLVERPCIEEEEEKQLWTMPPKERLCSRPRDATHLGRYSTFLFHFFLFIFSSFPDSPWPSLLSLFTSALPSRRRKFRGFPPRVLLLRNLKRTLFVFFTVGGPRFV